MTTRLRLPALRLWHRECAAGTRSPTQMDWLRAAAGWEQAAREIAHDNPDGAREYVAHARAIVLCAKADPEALPHVLYDCDARTDWVRDYRTHGRGRGATWWRDYWARKRGARRQRTRGAA